MLEINEISSIQINFEQFFALKESGSTKRFLDNLVNHELEIAMFLRKNWKEYDNSCICLFSNIILKNEKEIEIDFALLSTKPLLMNENCDSAKYYSASFNISDLLNSYKSRNKEHGFDELLKIIRNY